MLNRLPICNLTILMLLLVLAPMLLLPLKFERLSNMLIVKYLYPASVLSLLLMLSACSTKPVVLSEPPRVTPIPAELVQYCPAVVVIPKDAALPDSLRQSLLNAAMVAECYRMQADLVDAYRRRE